eukprot:1160653-Pelagomonas_calceolata.AAC.1
MSDFAGGALGERAGEGHPLGRVQARKEGPLSPYPWYELPPPTWRRVADAMALLLILNGLDQGYNFGKLI